LFADNPKPLKFSSASRKARRSYFSSALVGLFAAVLLVGAWMLYTCVSVSLQAEENLHATLFTIRLVGQYVHDYGCWPKSWHELEQMPFPAEALRPLNDKLNVVRIGGSHGYDWPAQSPHLQKCVIIDFASHAKALINQAPMQFQAIKPNGPYYEYRAYGFVETLQETLKEAVANTEAT
jgi:hypothetical protein